MDEGINTTKNEHNSERLELERLELSRLINAGVCKKVYTRDFSYYKDIQRYGQRAEEMMQQAIYFMNRKSNREEILATTDEQGNTPLHHVLLNIKKYELCSVGADRVDRYDKTIELVERMLKNGANPNTKNDAGQTPLSITNYSYKDSGSEYWHQTLPNMLLDYGADYSLAYDSVVERAKHGDGRAVKALLDKGGNLEEVDNEGNTPLLAAHRYGYRDLAKELIKRGANVSATNEKRGFNLVVYALYDDDGYADEIRQHYDLLDLLLESQTFDPKITDKDGNNTLILLFKGIYLHNHQTTKFMKEYAQTLLEKGVDPNQENNEGETIYTYLEKLIAKRKKALTDNGFSEHTTKEEIDRTPGTEMIFLRNNPSELAAAKAMLEILPPPPSALCLSTNPTSNLTPGPLQPPSPY